MTESKVTDKLGQLVELPISEFVLHRKPMFLLDRLVSLKTNSAVCEWCVQEDNEFLVPGSGVPSYIGVEYMAQCIAVHGGACERALGFPPTQGFLLGTSQYHSDVPYFVPGSTYQVKCKKLISNLDGMCSFECSIFSNKQVIAAARIAVLQKPQGDSFNE